MTTFNFDQSKWLDPIVVKDWAVEIRQKRVRRGYGGVWGEPTKRMRQLAKKCVGKFHEKNR